MRLRWRLISSSGLDHTCSGHKWTPTHVHEFDAINNLKLNYSQPLNLTL